MGPWQMQLSISNAGIEIRFAALVNSWARSSADVRDALGKTETGGDGRCHLSADVLARVDDNHIARDCLG